MDLASIRHIAKVTRFILYLNDSRREMPAWGGDVIFISKLRDASPPLLFDVVFYVYH